MIFEILLYKDIKIAPVKAAGCKRQKSVWLKQMTIQGKMDTWRIERAWAPGTEPSPQGHSELQCEAGLFKAPLLGAWGHWDILSWHLWDCLSPMPLPETWPLLPLQEERAAASITSLVRMDSSSLLLCLTSFHVKVYGSLFWDGRV